LAREAHFPIEAFGADHFQLTPKMIGDLRSMNYLDRWKASVSHEWFHIKMHDHSLFQFDEGGVGASFQFMHCPLDVVTFPDYLTTLGYADTPSTRRDLRPEYQKVLETASERRHVTPIRFDYTNVGYRAGVHPIAHVHVGLDNQIRLGVDRKMNAVSFVLFVMRHMYPRCWERLLGRDSNRQIVKHVRATGESLSAEFWQDLDRIEMYFT
jgi:hypothetical protein